MDNREFNKVVLFEVSLIYPIEGHSKKRVAWLKNKITSEGIWTMPLCVEKTKNLLMDGHHRFEVAKELGLKFVPVEMYGYEEVEVYSLRDDRVVTAQQIFENHKQGVIYPYKTAKHIFKLGDTGFKGVSLNELK